MFSRRAWNVFVALLALGVGSGWASPQIASRPAEEWVRTLDQPNRVAGLQIDEVITRLRLRPGDIVADLGAGTGVFSVPFGRAVAPGGTVYAVEIDTGFFDYITEKAAAENVGNVVTVLGEFTDPALPTQALDVAFFHDVLHHIEDRAGYLRNLARYVRPNGRVAIIDFDATQSPHRDQPEMRPTRDEITSWMDNAGFQLSEEHFDVFDDKFFLVYSKR